LTGRTNQIRIHLWHLGHPVCGDAAYLKGKQMGDTQTLSVDDPPLCLHAWTWEKECRETGRGLPAAAD
jgi:23S rRNA-/tRNA-specific pseudouridylate synthase